MERGAAAGIPVIVLVTVLAVSGAAAGNDAGGSSEPELVLSQRFQRVIAAEMNAVQKGMLDLASSIPAGRWGDIITTGRGMINGYIMKKKLSEAEQAELKRSLPAGYRGLDGEFRDAALNMVRAAEALDMKAVNHSFYQLGETCIACHARYAQKRFPGFHQK